MLKKEFGRSSGLYVPIFLPEERGQKGFSLQSLTQTQQSTKQLITKPLSYLSIDYNKSPAVT